MPSVNRRTFVRAGAATSVATLLPVRSALAAAQKPLLPSKEFVDPDMARALALAAVDAAKAAGATYADVRLTRDTLQILEREPTELGVQSIGVRALVDGAWGFTASPYWTPGEAVRLAKDAVVQARGNTRVMTHPSELAPAPVTTGTWVTPMAIDPFTIPMEEKLAFVRDSSTGPLYPQFEHSRGGSMRALQCARNEKIVATTEGTYVSQTTYETSCALDGGAQMGEYKLRDGAVRYAPWAAQIGAASHTIVGAGWETFRNVHELLSRASEEAYASMFAARPSIRPVTIGRYTVVIDATTMGALVATSVGLAADLERVLGYEANGGGTSWIGSDPLALLGKFDFGSPMLSVSANRTMAQGPATVKWDDEGVAATEFPLVTQGILQDFLTTRDTAALLAPAYQRVGRPVRSNAGAMSASALEPTLTGVANLVMHPGAQDVRLEDMVQSVPRGLMLVNGTVHTDFQLRQLIIRIEGPNARFQEINNGRLGAVIFGAALVIDAHELWKNLIAIGGTGSRDTWPGPWYSVNAYTVTKGMPSQNFAAGVQAVPCVFQNMSILNARSI